MSAATAADWKPSQVISATLTAQSSVAAALSIILMLVTCATGQ